jgi:hypothetical protein
MAEKLQNLLLSSTCFRAFWASALTWLLTLLFYFETLRRKQNRSHDARSVHVYVYAHMHIIPITAHLIIIATLTPQAPQYNTTLVSWRWTRLWQQCFMRGDRMVWLKLEFNLIYCRFWWFPIMTWTRCFVWLLDGASYHSF